MAKITLTESKLRDIIKEAIENELSNYNNKLMYSREQHQLYDNFVKELNKHGVNDINLKDRGNGSYTVTMSPFKFNSNVHKIAEQIARKMNMTLDVDRQPAIVYLNLRNY